MIRSATLFGFVFLMLLGCAPKPVPPVEVAPTEQHVDYVTQVQPLLDRRCAVCHSCYNSPCQFKTSSYEGLMRGGTKAAVYDPERLSAAAPTRLFVDANTTAQWHREHGFYSVTRNRAQGRFNDSTLLSLLEAKRQLPRVAGVYRPEYDELACARDHDELESFLEDHPERGMPYGFPPLKSDEFDLIAQWLQQGAQGPNAQQEAKMRAPSSSAQRQIAKWEAFLNRSDPKHVMTARYLYEHLFLAHIRFEATRGEYYELVRSRTPSPKPVKIIPTLRPYDDPGAAPFYYRFRKISSTIVHKTHIVFTLDTKQLSRVRERFIAPPWLEEPHVMDYDAERSSNPFVLFAQIPVAARYAFLLDHSEYIVRTFIRGPVCKGQIALNVINDHFWVMFLDPQYDLSVKYPNFLIFNQPELTLPTERGSDFPALGLFSDDYIKRAIDFYVKRQQLYATIYTDGLGYDAIWPGEEADDAPLLSIYRHFDSASVHKGALGDLPKTLWVIDYPLLERIYYALVAGYDVFGNIGHQTNMRRYMDRLRVEGESYFLDFMPMDKRKKYFDDWNRNLNLLVEDKVFYMPSKISTDIDFSSDDPKREFAEKVIEKRLRPETNIALDAVNYFRAGEEHPPLPAQYRNRSDYLQAFRAVEKPGTNFIKTVNGYQSNLAYVRVRMPEREEDVLFSIVINRWHDNVAFMFDESSRLDPSKDAANFIFDFVGSYPNIFIDMPLKQVPDFFEMLQNYEDTPQWRQKFFGFAITRDNPKFWEIYDWFQRRFEQTHPVDAGLFDLNRYYDTALGADYYGEAPGEIAP